MAPDGEGQIQHGVAGLDSQHATRPVLLPGPDIILQLLLHDADVVVEKALHRLK